MQDSTRGIYTEFLKLGKLYFTNQRREKELKITPSLVFLFSFFAAELEFLMVQDSVGR